MKPGAVSLTRLLGFPGQTRAFRPAYPEQAAYDGREPMLCDFCSGTGRCARCDGTGLRLIGRGWMGIHRTAACIVCYRSGRCQLCYGNGAYRTDH